MKPTHIALILLTLSAFISSNAKAQTDTIYIYESWEAIFDSEPDAMLLNPTIDAYTPFDIDFNINESSMNQALHNETVALTVGDSIWMLNTHWLNKNFKGDCRRMDHWVPLYFSAKIAFVTWTDYQIGLGRALLGGLLGDPYLFADESQFDNGDIYIIDFDDARVYKLDHKALSKLLEPYRDLKVRYESMKDYKKRHIIRTFFMEYINRLNDDPNVPFII